MYRKDCWFLSLYFYIRTRFLMLCGWQVIYLLRNTYNIMLSWHHSDYLWIQTRLNTCCVIFKIFKTILQHIYYECILLWEDALLFTLLFLYLNIFCIILQLVIVIFFGTSFLFISFYKILYYPISLGRRFY